MIAYDVNFLKMNNFLRKLISIATKKKMLTLGETLRG